MRTPFIRFPLDGGILRSNNPIYRHFSASERFSFDEKENSRFPNPLPVFLLTGEQMLPDPRDINTRSARSSQRTNPTLGSRLNMTYGKYLVTSPIIVTWIRRFSRREVSRWWSIIWSGMTIKIRVGRWWVIPTIRIIIAAPTRRRIIIYRAPGPRWLQPTS